MSLTFLAIARVAFEGSADSRVYNAKDSKLVLVHAPPANKADKKKNEEICYKIINVGLTNRKMELGKKLQLNLDDKQHLLLAQLFYADASEQDMIIVFAIVTNNWTQSKSANELLRELKDSFLRVNSIQELRAAKEKDSGVEKRSAAFLPTIMTKYGNDILAVVQGKADEVRVVMQKNVDDALKNVENLSVMEKKAEDLEEQGQAFSAGATKLKKKFCQQYWKVTLAIVFLVILILVIIVASLCSGAGKCGKSS